MKTKLIINNHKLNVAGVDQKMSFDANWNVDKYKEEHESDDMWELRKAFLLKWKNDYSEERLVCLARLFTNIECLGCTYPIEVMDEISKLSCDIPNEYRDKRKTRLQRTFVSASEAAADHIQRPKQKSPKTKNTNKIRKHNTNEIKKHSKRKKPKKINFVAQSNEVKKTLNNENLNNVCDSEQNITEMEIETKSDETLILEPEVNRLVCQSTPKQRTLKLFYTKEMLEVKCLNSALFNESMFETEYGKLVLVIKPWIDVASNVIDSCKNCELSVKQTYKEKTFTLTVNGKVMASAEGTSKKNAKEVACKIAWNYLRHNVVSLMVKEEWIAQNNTCISNHDILPSNNNNKVIPMEDSVALKMMKLMGWKGGGLGVDCQGIAEPIQANSKKANRNGIGHKTGGFSAFRTASMALMQRHIDALDGDLVFSPNFMANERAIMHKCATRCGLESLSYGSNEQERFLVVSNKVDPFKLVPAVTKQGGDTPKYRVYIPAALADKK
ncbi:uncharacterized protein [Epargyreus clarus]|uniref:uncharacterized protein n=1 Tax=Epargyreus clarus TaxID=520877 RepID=UPI003C305DAC